MKKEVCLENLTDIERAYQRGANRVELCDNLAEGGTTPSFGVVVRAVVLAKKYNRELAVMIRPRGGDFVYNEEEFLACEEDVCLLASHGVERMVLGMLTESGILDVDGLKRLLTLAREINPNMRFTFHMAFDHIRSEEDKLATLPILETMGFDTVLTHGKSVIGNILENTDMLASYFSHTQMTIMPGGGLSHENLDAFLEKLSDVVYVHGRRIINLEG